MKLSIIQVCAPTNEANDEDKDNFYEQLQTVVDSVHKHDILLVMGGLNAKVGEDNEGYENIIGSHGVGERNDNGERIVDYVDSIVSNQDIGAKTKLKTISTEVKL